MLRRTHERKSNVVLLFQQVKPGAGAGRDLLKIHAILGEG